MFPTDMLSNLTTEAVNPRTIHIDELDTLAMVGLLQEENTKVHDAVKLVVSEIAQAVDMLADTLRNGKRMVYVGAGTSGRLGILDASEMPPTFGLDPTLINGLIAGGYKAVFTSVEGAEDSMSAGSEALVENQSTNPIPIGMVVGISASGRTPFVLGALEHAAKLGLHTVLVSTNQVELVRAFAPFADLCICAVVGPEPITGSTRMKSGTAQKLILNMLTTGAMVLLGKTYGNVMVDLQPTNEKLKNRAVRIVCQLAHTNEQTAIQTLEQTNWKVKVAVVMIAKSYTEQQATNELVARNGRLRMILEEK